MAATPSQTSAPSGPGTEAPPPETTLTETVISSRPDRRFVQALRDLWAYRDLFAAFVRRDLTVRYRQTALGIVWVVLQPLATGGMFAAIFRRLGVGGDGPVLDSLLFFLAAVVPWMSFSSAVGSCATSLESNANLIAKVYFPRLCVPGAYVAGSAVDYGFAFLVLVGFALAAGAFTPWLLVAAVPLLAMQLLTAAGVGTFFAILDAQYRDVKYVVPFVLMIGMFLTVLVRPGQWGETAGMLLTLNPMLAIAETYRALLTGNPVDWALACKGAVVACAVFVGGVWFFRFRESRLVDVL
ncbi:MAG: ABC transporter permease [Candidatus Sumerlaeia bacterium]|nr:ABC transporter permease [Candidatus Sumerlaeia bacterium]